MVIFKRNKEGFAWALQQAKWNAEHNKQDYAIYVSKEEPTGYVLCLAAHVKQSYVEAGTSAVRIRPDGSQEIMYPGTNA